MRRQKLQLVEEDLNQPEPAAKWFLPELKSAMRPLGNSDELGLRQLLEFPEAIGGRARRGRCSAGGWTNPDDPNWPDAA